MKNKKTIIGFLGDSGVGKTTAADYLASKGFYRVSIQEKVEEFAKHFFSEEEFAKNRKAILSNMRLKGIKVHQSYWINLVLISIPDDQSFIVIDDIVDEEYNINNPIYQIYVCRPDVSNHQIEGIKSIMNNGDLATFLKKIETLRQNISKI